MEMSLSIIIVKINVKRFLSSLTKKLCRFEHCKQIGLKKEKTGYKNTNTKSICVSDIYQDTYVYI